ncbi:MAG: serine protease [Pyrinomonadaceae bacterium]
MQIRQAVTGIGSLWHESACRQRSYLGSCASVVRGDIFVTAAHCVSDCDVNALGINHFGAAMPECFTRAREVHIIPEADIAVIATDAPEARWACPFQSVQYAADFGEEVYAIGHPEDVLSATPNQPTLRFLRGIIQRPFLFAFPGLTLIQRLSLVLRVRPALAAARLFWRTSRLFFSAS